MRCLGVTQGWSFFEHASHVVAVDIHKLDVTDVIGGDAASALVASSVSQAWRPMEASPRAEAAASLAGEALADALLPTALSASVDVSGLYEVPEDVRTAAKRALRQHTHHQSRDSVDPACLSTARVLASGNPISLERLRYIARYFMLNAVTVASAGKDPDTSAARLVRDLHGGDAGARWARTAVRYATSSALMAAAYDVSLGMEERDVPETDTTDDPAQPHQFSPALDAEVCIFCGKSEYDPVHDPAAVDYAVSDIDPAKPHHFSEDPVDPAVCDICGRASDDDLHKQAALASYYDNRQFYDDLLATDAELRRKRSEAVTAGGAVLISGSPDDPDGTNNRYADIREAADDLFWVRQGHEDEDPLTYFVSQADPADPMVVDGLYAFDGQGFHRLDPDSGAWVSDPLPQGDHIYQIDDETAHRLLESLLLSPGATDMRQFDPGEAYLMEECAPSLDHALIDRSLLSDGAPLTAPGPTATDVQPSEGGGYSGQDRARNAARQARGGDGKFAPGSGGSGIPAKQSAAAAKAKSPASAAVLGADGLTALFAGFSKYVEDQRAQAPVTAAADPAGAGVAPIRMAILDPSDPASVLDLVALVPASDSSLAPKLLKRVKDGKWEEDIVLLRQLQGLAPPPVSVLSDDASFQEVLSQVDAFYAEQKKDDQQDERLQAAAVYGPYGEIIAAGIPGIADTPGDVAAAERLKLYWTVGKGGAKIRWNTPGDWTRAYRYLRKYMGPRAKGYVSNLHKLMTGVWPGDRRNIGHRGHSIVSSIGDPYDVASSEMVIELSAAAATAAGGAPLTAAADAAHGAPFVIKVLAPIGSRSGDARRFTEDSLSHRDLPLPLLWQIKTGSAHDNSVIVGRIDSVDVLPDGSLGNARGVFDIGTYGAEAERLVRHKFLRGVSVDLDNFEALQRRPKKGDDTAADRIKQDDIDITQGRMLAATLVAKPAFQECSIELGDDGTEEIAMVADGTYIADPFSAEETADMVEAALVASGIPLHPPKEWFKDPGLREKTPMHVDETGRVFGHIATWDVDHIGLPFSTRPPKSRSGYSYFHTGLVRTADGSDVAVGQLTLAGGHADGRASAAAAAQHYDNTMSAFADVIAGEDAHGIWVAGALRPGVTGEQLRAIRASAPSGDWRPINGRLEMVAVLQVNVPGFPNTRAVMASGEILSLVAAGTAVLNRIRSEQASGSTISVLADRVASLEARDHEKVLEDRAAVLSRVAPVRDARNAELQQKMAELRDHISASGALDEAQAFRNYSAEKRMDYADKGFALPDGSYPIATITDLRNAISAFGRAKDKDAVRRHIRKRARALGRSDMLPRSWSEAAIAAADLSFEVEEASARFAIIAAGGRYPNGEPWNPKNHPRGEGGKFRTAVARIRKAAVKSGQEEIVRAADKAAQAEARGNVEEAQDAAREVMKQVDDSADEIASPDTVKELRHGYRNLGEAVANLPITMGDINEKFRFTDLPPDLQSLIRDLMKRVKKNLEPEAAAKALSGVQDFISGVEVLSQPDISAELSRMLRYLI